MYILYRIIVTFLKVKKKNYNKIGAKNNMRDAKKKKSVNLAMKAIWSPEQLVFTGKESQSMTLSPFCKFKYSGWNGTYK